jgi:prevent-host-death family protein
MATLEPPRTTYSVADAKSGLPRLIDLALEGHEVIITRHGKPVAELRPIRQAAPPSSADLHEWMKARRDRLPAIDVTSVQLLDELHEDPEG